MKKRKTGGTEAREMHLQPTPKSCPFPRREAVPPRFRASVFSGDCLTAEIEREGNLEAPLAQRRGVTARGVPEGLEARHAAALRLEPVLRERVVPEAAGMRDVVRAAADGAIRPRVDHIEDERRVRVDGGMQRGRRLPRLVSNARHVLAGAPRGMQRNVPPVARDDVTRVDHPARHELEALHR